MLDDAEIAPYFRGDRLYGNDFNEEQILQWYQDEETGYYDLGTTRRSDSYAYHALNGVHGIRYLPNRSFEHALGIGSAYGKEFHPLCNRIARITIIEPCEEYWSNEIGGVPATYLKAQPSGDLTLESESVDLVTCFGCLHHVPNVGHVLRECGRVLRPAGWMLMREPVVSMGDWRRPRRGLTKHERGIPLDIMREFASTAGLHIANEAIVGFAPLRIIWRRISKRPIYSSCFATWTDAAISRLFRWNYSYHARSFFEKLRPTGAYWVLTKR
jgi:SAM-dependent methyltransferase